MAIDKLMLASAIKFSAFGFYLIYFIFFNTGLNIYLPEYKNSDSIIKKNFIGDYCFLILGGSNARQGISAEKISESICSGLNLGFNDELGGFYLYIKWLEANLDGRKYESILYSPSLFWSTNSIIDENLSAINFPKVPIITQLKNLIITDPIFNFNSRGDVNNYFCEANFLSFNIKEKDFSRANAFVIQELNRRVLLLNNVTKSKNLYVRVPPVYVKTKSQADLYVKLMNERIEILKGLGVKVVGSTIVSTDNSLFCDSFHPNAKGREAFTKEIVLP